MIVFCGEALINMIPTETVGGEQGYVPQAGGAVFNIAIAFGRLGARAGILKGFRTNLFGQQLSESMEASHLDLSQIVRSDRLPTLTFFPLTDGHVTYSFHCESSAGRMLSYNDMLARPAEVSGLHFGGISLSCDSGADACAALLEQQSADRAVMIAPNIRANFVRTADQYRSRLEEMIARVDIVKVSDEDLDLILTEPISLQEKVKAVITMEPSVVILTRSSEDATCYLCGGGQVHVPAGSVEIANTVGVGDTFNGGLLAKLLELGELRKIDLRNPLEFSLKLALQHGSGVAAVTVTRAEANSPWAAGLAMES